MTTALALNPICLDALREIGNIGLGNAMTALATMIDQGVDMAVPHVSVISLGQFAHLVGGEETVSACVYMPVLGEAPGRIALFLPDAGARHLADCLLGQPPGTTQEFDEIVCSALMEIGNILASTYLVAVGDLTGLSLLSSPPAFAVDMTAAILASIAGTFEEDDEQALTIVTRIGDPNGALTGFFLYVPDHASIAVLLTALGMADEITPTFRVPCPEPGRLEETPAALLPPAEALVCEALVCEALVCETLVCETPSLHAPAKQTLCGREARP